MNLLTAFGTHSPKVVIQKRIMVLTAFYHKCSHLISMVCIFSGQFENTNHYPEDTNVTPLNSLKGNNKSIVTDNLHMTGSEDIIYIHPHKHVPQISFKDGTSPNFLVNEIHSMRDISKNIGSYDHGLDTSYDQGLSNSNLQDVIKNSDYELALRLQKEEEAEAKRLDNQRSTVMKNDEEYAKSLAFGSEFS